MVMDRLPLPFKWQWNLGTKPKRISTPVLVSPPDESFLAPLEEHPDVHAIWDTGAAQTYVTPRLSQRLNLPFVGMRPIGGITPGQRISPVHLAFFTVPEPAAKGAVQLGVGFPGPNPVTLLHSDEVLDNGRYDVLIGMDLICLGDFSLAMAENGDWLLTLCWPHAATLPSQTPLRPAKQE